MDSVRLSVNISPESRQILERVAARVHYNEGGQLPLGQIVTAMIEWFEDEEEWDEIEENVRTQFVRKVQERKERDRERKRKAY
jgi:hypothetical protein